MFYIPGAQDANGDYKYRYKIVPRDTDHLEEDSFGNWWPINQSETFGRRVVRKHAYIPCGKCIGCRLDYSRQWANRLMLEYKYHDPNKCWFVTLTYNDENVPVNTFADVNTGELGYSLSLDKVSIQKFVKRLRKSYPQEKLRYYLCGEYGEHTRRPHYHAIFFDLPLDSSALVKWTTTSQGFTLYKCKELEKIWSCGNVIVSPVSWETCAYTSRYVTKKLNGPAAQFYETFNIEPEFCLMSRKPGIARQYFDEHPEVIEKGIHFSAGSRAINCEAPRYFKGIFKVDNALESAIMSYKSSKQQDVRVVEQMKVNGLAMQDYDRYLRSEEYQKRAMTAALKRGSV